MEKKIIAIISILLVSTICFAQDKTTEFTEQDKKGVAFAEKDAMQAIGESNIYIISGGEGNEPIVEEKDLAVIKGLPMKSIGSMGDFEYANKFNATITQYLRRKKPQTRWFTNGQPNGLFVIENYYSSKQGYNMVGDYITGVIDCAFTIDRQKMKKLYPEHRRVDVLDKVIAFYKNNPDEVKKPVVDVVLSGCK